MLILAQKEGKAVYNVPGVAEPCHTWYKTFGDIHGDVTPLITLHGGPGACHEYLLPLTDIKRPLIFYDQIGNGKSTHLPEKKGDESFWTVELFKNELANLIRHLGLESKPYDLYGQSWGGMLAAEWALSTASSHLRRLVLSNSLADVPMYARGMDILVSRLPEDAQKVIAEARKTQNWDSPELQEAMLIFYKRHFSLKRPFPPPELQPALEWLAKDPTVYSTMYGPNELLQNGSLKDWSIVDKVHNIKVPTLLMTGVQEGEPSLAMRPFWNKIEKVKWIEQDNAAHFSHIDQRETYMEYLKSFLAD